MLEMLCHLEGPFLPTGREQYHNISTPFHEKGFFFQASGCVRVLWRRGHCCLDLHARYSGRSCLALMPWLTTPPLRRTVIEGRNAASLLLVSKCLNSAPLCRNGCNTPRLIPAPAVNKVL